MSWLGLDIGGANFRRKARAGKALGAAQSKRDNGRRDNWREPVQVISRPFSTPQVSEGVAQVPQSVLAVGNLVWPRKDASLARRSVKKRSQDRRFPNRQRWPEERIRSARCFGKRACVTLPVKQRCGRLICLYRPLLPYICPDFCGSPECAGSLNSDARCAFPG